MKATKIFFAALAALALGACQNEKVEFAKPVTAQISGNIGDKALSTRAHDNVWGATDKIGVFVYTGGTTDIYKNLENSLFTYTSDTKTIEKEGTSLTYNVFSGATVEFPSDGSNLDFIAYYPYQGTLVNNTFTISDWSNQNNSESFDFMTAEKVSGNEDIEAGNNIIPFVFKHKCSRIILNLYANYEESQLQTSDLAYVTAEGEGLNVSATCNVLTGEVTPGSANNTPINFKKSADNIAEAIICPNYNNGERRVVFTFKGKTCYWIIPTTQTFKPGIKYIWNLKLKSEGLVSAELVGTIEDWSEEKPKGDDIIDVDNPFVAPTNP